MKKGISGPYSRYKPTKIPVKKNNGRVFLARPPEILYGAVKHEYGTKIRLFLTLIKNLSTYILTVRPAFFGVFLPKTARLAGFFRENFISFFGETVHKLSLIHISEPTRPY